MKRETKISIETSIRKMAADLYTPVGIYLRLRDRFRDTILLESTNNSSSENSYSFIAINAIGGIEITSKDAIEIKFPGSMPEKLLIDEGNTVPEVVWNYMQQYEVVKPTKETKLAQGLFGYTAYDSIPFFETISFDKKSYDSHPKPETSLISNFIPLMRYRLYQYVIAIDN